MIHLALLVAGNAVMHDADDWPEIGIASRCLDILHERSSAFAERFDSRFELPV